jgi:small subunit ribosomal protein S2
MTAETKEKSEKKETGTKKHAGLDLEEMARAGLHFGHQSSRIHPKMMPYLQGVRNTVHLINIEKTAEKLAEALKFVKELIAEGKTLLLVGTKIQVKDLVKETAGECGLPYVSERWLGGTFSNFGIIRKRIEYFKDLENKRASGELEKYTKKERAKFDHEIRGLEIKFGGIKNMEKLPDAIFVADMIKDELAIKEAREAGVKTIGICDTNTDPSLVDFPIPANDDAISSVKYILDKIKETVLNAQRTTKSEK